VSVSEVKRPPDENSLPQRARQFFRETRSELRKVVWPTREEATKLTLIVLAVMVAMAIILGSIDAVFSLLFRFLLGN
jgi:preprotein translocase subunit SecE